MVETMLSIDVYSVVLVSDMLANFIWALPPHQKLVVVSRPEDQDLTVNAKLYLWLSSHLLHLGLLQFL